MSNLIYLDNSATTFPKPEEVYTFMDSFYRNHGVSPGRSGFDAAIETEGMVDETRKMLTKMFNGDDPDRLTFSYNASDSLNMIIQGLAEKGDHVVTTGGIYGKISEVKETTIILEISKDVQIKVDKNGVVKDMSDVQPQR